METSALQHAYQTKSLSFGKHLKNESGDRSPFITLLETTSQDAKVAENIQFATIDTEKLAEELATLLPQDVALYSSNMLDNESLKDILSMLPPEVQEEIQIFFESQQDVPLTEKVLSEQSASAAVLLAFIQHAANEDVGLGKEYNAAKLSEILQKQMKGSQGAPLTVMLADDKASTNHAFHHAEKLESYSRLLKIEYHSKTGFVFQISHNQEKTQLPSSLSHALFPKELFSGGLNRRFGPAQPSNTELPVFYPGSMTAAEQLSLQLPQGNKLSENRFLAGFHSLLQKAKISAFAGGTTAITLKLNPENLGSISIELVQKNGEMTAKITAATLAAKEAIDNQMGTLKQALSQQKITLEQIDVFVHEKNMVYKDQSHKEHHQDSRQHEPYEEKNEDQENGAFSSILDLLNERV